MLGIITGFASYAITGNLFFGLAWQKTLFLAQKH
jgi:hypothetical protein